MKCDEQLQRIDFLQRESLDEDWRQEIGQLERTSFTDIGEAPMKQRDGVAFIDTELGASWKPRDRSWFFLATLILQASDGLVDDHRLSDQIPQTSKLSIEHHRHDSERIKHWQKVRGAQEVSKDAVCQGNRASVLMDDPQLKGPLPGTRTVTQDIKENEVSPLQKEEEQEEHARFKSSKGRRCLACSERNGHRCHKDDGSTDQQVDKVRGSSACRSGELIPEGNVLRGFKLQGCVERCLHQSIAKSHQRTIGPCLFPREAISQNISARIIVLSWAR